MKHLSIHTILAATDHRPFPYPAGKWAFYQEWQEVLFLHWKIPYELLRRIVPAALTLDSYQGNYYISLVPFTMRKVRPRYLPAFPPISDFHEVNLRTYILQDGHKGVYFLNIEAEKWISTLLSKMISGMPYEKSSIRRTNTTYQAAHRPKAYSLQLDYTVSNERFLKTELDTWLTERYCLFLTEKQKIVRFDVHHLEWEIKALKLNTCQLHYRVGNLLLANTPPDLLHYSPGVQVVAWPKKQC